MNPTRMFSTRVASRWLAGAGLVLALFGGAYAGTTDIANAPLFTSSSDAVKPNIMFVLDDSGSMAWDYLPDDAQMTGKYGYLSSQCNGVAYNPATTYTLPVDATGVSVAPGSLGFITPSPITQTTSQQTLAPIATMPTSASSSFQVTVTASGRSGSWYSTSGGGTTVTVFQSGDSTRFVTGQVTGWNSTSGLLTISLASGTVVGTGPMLTPLVGVGPTASSTYYRYTGTQPRLSYIYNSSGVLTTPTFYIQCNSTIGSSPGNAVFTPVAVNSLSAEAQNYANWYQYYRTRIKMMQSALSLAFKGIDNRFRVGYSTISERTAVEASPVANFVDIRDFDSAQKTKVYAAFNAANAANWTPLRGALSKAGQYFANKARSQTSDPMQYSCQRNFTILSTDGEWNTNQESTTTPKYGPYKLDNTTNVGEQDGSGTLRPMLDGNSVSSTTTETWTSTAATVTTGVTPVTTVTTSSKGTTTFTPVTGYSQYIYTLPVKQALTSSSSIARPSNSSPYYVVVTTSFNHGYSTGDSITVTGGSVSGYTGTFTVTVLSPTSFEYPAAGGSRPGNPSGVTSYTIAPTSAQSCSAGSGLVVQQKQTRDAVSPSTTTVTNTTTTMSTVTTLTTTSQITPYKRVVTTLNGNVSSDVTTAGTLSTANSVTSTTSISPSVTATASTTAVGTNTFTTWVNSGSTSTTGSCTSTAPASPSAATTLGSPSTSATISTTAPVTSGPTATNGTTTISVGATTTSQSTHVTTISNQTLVAGTSDTLADIAMYYYVTDLRNSSLGNCTGALGVDVCTDNVKGAAGDARHSYGDSATWQHMTTFTLGLGTSGLLKYDPNYLTQLSGDFFDILNGAQTWPAAGPTKTTENVDDLWHAAVDGRGSISAPAIRHRCRRAWTRR